ncbi:hypothetical protein PYW07_006872 [Mythimna separata]|uniref:Neuroblastoma-amplified sequence n=1 Tax=Mythimna separata TaxID=271217 RepID=A0AAD8DZJ2_MYTSE|nr:hypothetical protein PYW07_006872 [Mythimna separata]
MEENKSILHELYVFSEWKPEPEYIQKSDSILPENISAIWRWLNFLGPKKSLIDGVTTHLEKQQKWHIALGDEGKVIAVLTDNILEIRTKRSEYATIAARTTVSRDAYPQWRKLVWSPDCSFVVLAYGNGVVSFFDLTASNLFSIPIDCSRPGGLECTDNTHAVADIIFMPLRAKDTKWNWEVLVVTYDGKLRGFLVSQTDGCKLHHSFRFAGGVAAIKYCEPHSTLYVAGVPRGSAKEPNSSLSAGIRAWRILNEEPYYKLSVVSDDLEAHATERFKLYVPFGYSNNAAFIVQMELSPDGTKLVCLHCNGDVSIWRLPLLKLEYRWPLNTQPHHDLRNPLAGEDKPGKKKDLTVLYPADINWWSNEEIIVSRFSGAVTICDIETMANILGKKPEFFQGSPQITCAHGGTFMVLECESNVLPAKKSRSDESMEVVRVESDTEDTMFELAKELIKTVLFSITDMETFQPKPRRITVLSRVYRLLGLKSTTPTDLFSRKVSVTLHSFHSIPAKPRRITVLSRVYRLLGLKSTTPTDLFSRKVSVTLHSFHSIPAKPRRITVLSRVYRLLGLKSTTPTDLFSRKVSVTLHSFHSIPAKPRRITVLSRVYRLLGLKSTTPTDLFSRKVSVTLHSFHSIPAKPRRITVLSRVYRLLGLKSTTPTDLFSRKVSVTLHSFHSIPAKPRRITVLSRVYRLLGLKSTTPTDLFSRKVSVTLHSFHSIPAKPRRITVLSRVYRLLGLKSTTPTDLFSRKVSVTLHSFHSIPAKPRRITVLSRVYRLLGLKSTTPTDLFSRKVSVTLHSFHSIPAKPRRITVLSHVYRLLGLKSTTPTDLFSRKVSVTLHSFHSIPAKPRRITVLSRVYRLLGLKSTTPTDLFSRKVSVTLHSFHSIPAKPRRITVLSRVYRLLGLKSTTPTDLFSRKVSVTLHSFHSIPAKPRRITVLSRVYRLLGLKSTTPTDLFSRKVSVTLHSFHSIPAKPRRITVLSRVYRLLGLKSTTPTDLFSRKVSVTLHSFHSIPAKPRRITVLSRVYRLLGLKSTTPTDLFSRKVSVTLHSFHSIPAKPRRITVLSRVYRLLGLKSTTPTDLFSRKIESGHYSEALALADTFGLDSDLVYQQQWRKNPVSTDAIQNYLSKVSKKIWAVHQCVDRLPETLPAAKELLQFGLELTDETILDEINKEQIDPLGDPDDILLEHLNAYTSELLRCRHVMLFYKERLKLYESILKCEKSTYLKDEYDRLRSNSIVHSAIEIAKEGRIEALTCLWPHIKTTVMQLAVLDNLPETINPLDYQHLLPTRHPFEWFDKRSPVKVPPCLPEDDWCRKEAFRSIWSSNWSEDSTPELETAGAIPSATDDIVKWYDKRAREIEERSGLVSHALTLVTLATIGGGVEGLDAMMFHLLTLDVLTYDLNIEGVTLDQLQKMTTLEVCTILMSLSTPKTFVSDLKQFVVPFLKRWEKLSNCNESCVNGLIRYLENISIEDLSAILLVLQSPSEFELDVRTHLELVERCLYAHTGTEQLDKACDLLDTLLKDRNFSNAATSLESGVVDTSKLAPVIDGSISSSELVRRVKEVERLVSASSRLAWRGVAVPPKDLQELQDHPQTAVNLLTKLSRSLALGDGSISSSELVRRVKEVERLVSASSRLAWRGVAVPPKDLQELQDHPQTAVNLLTKLSRSLALGEEKPTPQDWEKLLKDMLDLQSTLFSCITRDKCYEIYALALLTSGDAPSIRLASEVLTTSAEQRRGTTQVSYYTSVALVMAAAQEYFNSANSLVDPALELAKCCLLLIKDDNIEIQQELDLLNALPILHSFNVGVVPVQVRICEDRISLIEACLMLEPNAYLQSHKLLKLAALLKISGDDELIREGKVLQLAGNFASNAGVAGAAQGSGAAVELSRRLATLRHAPAAALLAHVADTAHAHADTVTRRQLYAAAVTFTEPENIEEILRAR